MPIWPFKNPSAAKDAELLLDAVINASRQPDLYGDGKVPDTLEGRFELITLHAGSALIRLRADAGAGELAQNFTDKLFRYLDSGLREAGVGDLTVPKKIRRLAGAFYGRVDAYRRALEAGRGELEAALVRNVWGGVPSPFVGALADRVQALEQQLAQATVESMLTPAPWAASWG